MAKRKAVSREEALPVDLRTKVEAAYQLRLRSAARLVDMGDECDIWCAETSRGRIAIRVSPASRSEDELDWSHRLVAYVARHVSEAVAPLVSADGRTLFQWEGLPVSLYPWVDGEPLVRTDDELCDAAARLLARLHKAMRGWTVPSPSRFAPHAQQTRLADEDLDTMLRTIDESPDLLRGATHGDYYPRNLICRKQRIVAVIDWDESHDDLLVQELAWAVWEFAQDASRADLDAERARRFVAAYADEGGPVPVSERGLILPLIRKRLREEVIQAMSWAASGRVIDEVYMQREIAAFGNLRNLGSDWYSQ